MSTLRSEVERLATIVESDVLAITYQSLGQYRRDLLEVIRGALALPTACRWHQDDEGSDLWLTGCRRSFRLDEGGPRDNRMEYCCYCGRPMHEVPWEDEPPTEGDACS